MPHRSFDCLYRHANVSGIRLIMHHEHATPGCLVPGYLIDAVLLAGAQALARMSRIQILPERMMNIHVSCPLDSIADVNTLAGGKSICLSSQCKSFIGVLSSLVQSKVGPNHSHQSESCVCKNWLTSNQHLPSNRLHALICKLSVRRLQR